MISSFFFSFLRLNYCYRIKPKTINRHYEWEIDKIMWAISLICKNQIFVAVVAKRTWQQLIWWTINVKRLACNSWRRIAKIISCDAHNFQHIRLKSQIDKYLMYNVIVKLKNSLELNWQQQRKVNLKKRHFLPRVLHTRPKYCAYMQFSNSYIFVKSDKFRLQTW